MESQSFKVFAKSKFIISPGKEIIVSVKLKSPINLNSDFVLISPCSFEEKFLVGSSICKKKPEALYIK